MPTLLDEPILNQKNTNNPKIDQPKTDFPKDRAYTKAQAMVRFTALKNEYMLWRPAFMDIKKYIAPLNGIFDTMPTSRAQMIDHKTLLDDYAVQAAGVMASGLTSGMTSPSSPWVKLELDIDREMTAEENVWLADAENVIYMMLKRSNIYSCLHNCHKELGVFGTGCFAVIEDFEDIVRGKSFTVGQYYLGVDSKGRPNAFGHEIWMQVGQMVQEFGYENCSATVRYSFDYNKKDVWIKIFHLIEPNDNAIGELKDYKNMPFRSCYFDPADTSDRFLSTRGFKKFPIVAPRWEVNSTDQIYGYGRGWYALGNAKELQKAKYDKLTARDLHNRPPVIQDASVEGHAAMVPGGVTKTTAQNVPNSGVRPAYQVQYDAQGHQLTRQELREDIDREFHVDLFKMLINNGDTTQKTAYEIAEWKQEQIMQMGPVLYNIEKGELDVLIELMWDIAVENNIVPEPPESLQGAPIKVVYVSLLAQAMKAIGVQTINRVIAFVGQLAAISPELGQRASDNLDVDEGMRMVNKMEGGPAKLIRDPKIVAQERDARNKAMQAAQTSAMMAQTAKGMADMGRVPMDDPSGKSNAGEAIVKRMTGKK